MNIRALVATVASVLALSYAAVADSIQKWRTPEGAFYFGDRPPVGSTLVDTIVDTPRSGMLSDAVGPSELERAAAEGRDIIRRREEDRSAERLLEADRREREDAIWARQQELDSIPDVIVVNPGRRPRHHHHHPHDRDGYRRPPSVRPPTVYRPRPPQSLGRGMSPNPVHRDGKVAEK